MTQTVTTRAAQEGPVSLPRSDRPLGVVVGVAAAVLLLLAVWSQLLRPSGPPVLSGEGPLAGVDQTVFAAETGVWVEHVALIAGDGVIEIRYRILDVDKSEVVHDTDLPPRLVTSEGSEFSVPRHDHAHVRDNRLAATYNEQVMNTGGQIDRGDVVTVHIGQFAVEGVRVQ